MSVVETTIDLGAPPQTVWDLVMDPHRLHEWVTIHRRLGHVDSGPPRRGFEMEQVINLRGVTIKVSWTLADCRPGELAVWEGRGPARSTAHTEYRLSPAGDGGTRFAYRNEFIAPLGPLGAAVSRALVGGIPRREADRSLDRLQALV
ncbi:MAG TPA: SRPBCC family protein [Solirubrobacteraceae bacterium]|jgi:carbon monoxide dehydrogenase subunit G|nr:SRPBCC family protein [Solirubrobacteraceae bacterium]